MKKVLLIASFFISTPLLILFCIVYLSFLSFQKQQNNLSFSPTPAVAYAALPSLDSTISDGIVQQDSRVEIVRKFFHKYGSPLEPLAGDVVKYADMYGVDFRLIPAIGMQESNACKKAPQGTNNCWGYGIYGGKITKFSSYSEGIQTVTKGIAHNYVANGLNSPYEIMSKYTPSSNGSWAKAVSQFLSELE